MAATGCLAPPPCWRHPSHGTLTVTALSSRSIAKLPQQTSERCQGEARTPLELQRLNAPAQPCPLLPRRCVGRVLVQRGCEASPGPCGGPGRSAPRREEGTSAAPLPTEGCWSSCPNENKIRRFSAVLTAMLKSSHFPTKERPSEKPKQTLTQATLEVGLSYKHRKLNTKPCYNSTEDLT